MSTLVGWIRWLVLLELRMYAGALRLLTRRSDVPEGSEPLSYVGAVSAVLWGFTIVSSVELVVVHLIVPWEHVRLALDILGIWGVLWCLGLTGCHYVYPHLVTESAFRIRQAARADALTVDWAHIASAVVRERNHPNKLGLQHDAESAALVVAIGGRTNLDVRLARPHEVFVKGQAHVVREVRIFADDPRAAHARIRERLAALSS